MPEFTAQDALDKAETAIKGRSIGLITADEALGVILDAIRRVTDIPSQAPTADLPEFPANTGRLVPLRLSKGSWTVWDMDTDERFGDFTTEIEAWSEVHGNRAGAGLPPFPAYSNGNGRELDWPKL